jgi:hypothetical protein
MEQELKSKAKPRKKTKRVQEVLGGEYLTRESVIRNIPYLLFITVLALFYIANIYSTERLYKDIERTKSELKELRYRYITTRSALMFQSRQSNISVKAQKFGLRETKIPPYKIYYNGH